MRRRSVWIKNTIGKKNCGSLLNWGRFSSISFSVVISSLNHQRVLWQLCPPPVWHVLYWQVISRDWKRSEVFMCLSKKTETPVLKSQLVESMLDTKAAGEFESQGQKKNPLWGLGQENSCGPLTSHLFVPLSQYCVRNYFAEIKLSTNYFRIIHHESSV